MDIFSAFPRAVRSDEWEIGRLNRQTAVGVAYEALNALITLADWEDEVKLDASPSAASIKTDTLVYAKPETLPTTVGAVLSAGYLLKHLPTGTIYEIEKVGIGENMENGTLEHIELYVKPTEVMENE